MQKAFQTGASIALKVVVFGFIEYLQSYKLECFVAFASLKSATPKQARLNRA
jgi:hypothetical protein